MHIQYNDIIQSPAMLMSQHAVGQLILNAFKFFIYTHDVKLICARAKQISFTQSFSYATDGV
jgi:hypothetical protein